VIAAATARPTAAPTPKPTAAPSEPPIVGGTPVPIAASAQSLVRRYLEALIHGDEASGYASLGGDAGDPGLTLSEEAFLDPNAHVTSVRTTSADASSALVEAEISTAKGTYYGTYHVAYGKHGVYIASHDYIKV
jgi:hypothetical protein